MLQTRTELFILDFIDMINDNKIQTLTKTKWKTTTSVVTSTHPPVVTIVFDHLGAPIIASPFKRSKDNSDLDHKMMIEQHNYTSQSLEHLQQLL